MNVDQYTIKFDKTILSTFYDKCESLNVDGSQMLYTTFGPRTLYKVIRDTNGDFTMLQKDHLFTAKWKEMGHITSVESIASILREYPEAYAKNHFSCKLVHFDNYANFLNAFKIKSYEQ